MKADQKKKIFQLMREILYRSAEQVQCALKPLAGEKDNWDYALNVLKNSGVIDFMWNPLDKDNKPMIGVVMVILTAGNLLRVFSEIENEKH